jgi:hypothetical protein
MTEPHRADNPSEFFVRFGCCAVERRRFPVGVSPTRQPLQPEATGAAMEVTKWLKPSDIRVPGRQPHSCATRKRDHRRPALAAAAAIAAESVAASTIPVISIRAPDANSISIAPGVLFPASPEPFSTRSANSNASGRTRWRPEPLECRSVLGPVKAWPGNAKREAKQVRRPALTAHCARRLSSSAGRTKKRPHRHEQRNCIR